VIEEQAMVWKELQGSEINPSTFPGRMPGVCSGVILSGASDPVLKEGVWHRRGIKT